VAAPEPGRDRRELFLEVEAGSTGKPNQAIEINNWKELAPFIMQMPGIDPVWMATGSGEAPRRRTRAAGAAGSRERTAGSAHGAGGQRPGLRVEPGLICVHTVL
jgi:hypothetical protein